MYYRSKTNRFNKNICRIEQKRTWLDQNLAGSKQSERSWPLYQQDRKENEVQSPAGSKQKKFHNVANKELHFLEEPEEQYTLH